MFFNAHGQWKSRFVIANHRLTGLDHSASLERVGNQQILAPR